MDVIQLPIIHESNTTLDTNILDRLINQTISEELFEKLWESTDNWDTYSNTEYLEFHHRLNNGSIFVKINCQNVYKFYYLYHNGKKAAYAVDADGSYIVANGITTWIERNLHMKKIDETFFIYHENESLIEEIENNNHTIYKCLMNSFVDHNFGKLEIIYEYVDGKIVLNIMEESVLVDNFSLPVSKENCDIRLKNFEVKYIERNPKYDWWGSIQEGKINYPSSQFTNIKEIINITPKDKFDEYDHDFEIREPLIFEKFSIKVKCKIFEYGNRYTIEYFNEKNTIARFRFLGINNEEAKVQGRTVNYPLTGPIDSNLDENLQSILLPGVYGYENKKKKFIIIERFVDHTFDLPESSEGFFIYLMNKYPNEIFDLLNTFENECRLWHHIMTYVSDTYSYFPLDINSYIFTPAIPKACDIGRKEIHDYQCMFIPEVSSFNISYILGSIPYYNRGGGTTSETSSGVQPTEKADFGIKVNMTENKMIINNEKSEMVEMDIATRVLKPVVRGYKYAHVFLPPSYSASTNWFVNLFTSPSSRHIKVIVELELFENSKTIVHPDKCRTNHCKILDIYDLNTGMKFGEAQGVFRNEFKYTVGQEIIITDFVNNSYKCAKGIHFCNTIAELKRYFG